MNQPHLYNWEGDGSGYEYTWVDEQKKIVCKYQPEKHSLSISYTESNSEVLSAEENLRTESKPSIFTMRTATERIVGHNISR